MKLNPDCMRDVMLEIEKIWSVRVDACGDIHMDYLFINTLYNTLPNYTKEEISYTIFNLEQAGYLKTRRIKTYNTISEYAVEYMTFTGHEFLNRIRDTQNWGRIKKGMNAIRNYSLDAITALSEGFTTAAISAVVKEIGS